MKTKWLIGAGVLLLALAGAFAGEAPATVPAARLERLTRGVNLSHWFSQIPRNGGRYEHAWFASYDTRRDFELLARAGFRHVRFPVEFEMFLDPAASESLRSEFLPDFDRALDDILGAGLAVIVDWHAREETKKRLKAEPAFAEQAAALWGAVAKHLAARDPERVFLEVMNEPAGGMSAAEWSAVQRRLVAAMRAAAPRHTIIATSHNWSGVADFTQLEPLPEGNVVYAFHCYEPMAFTHQGATWAGDAVKPIEGLIYPADAENRADLLSRLTDLKARGAVQRFLATRETMQAMIERAAEWGRRHRVPVTMNEFGVYTRVTPPESRYRWLRDVREAAEARGIGWCMWDYAGGFRVARGEPGQRVLDPECLRALGLQAGLVPETAR